MILTAHAVWIQGEAALPDEYRANLDAWRNVGAHVKLWDDGAARAHWPDYAAHEGQCSHHAMRADLILARALRDYGGLAIGTDSRPVNYHALYNFSLAHDAWVTVELGHKQVANGLVWFRKPGHPLVDCVCRHQLRRPSLLTSPNVPAVTGPGCWWAALNAHPWHVMMVSSLIAFTRQWFTAPSNPDGWIDPGFAASWWTPKAHT